MRISLVFLLLCLNYISFSQQYITKNAQISFFSKAPLEDISAINKNVGAIYDVESNDLVFQLNISDFSFRKNLMREHFNENYLESDKYPKSTFIGKVIESKDTIATVKGILKIHGVEHQIQTQGYFSLSKDKVHIKAKFFILLKDYKIKIPKIVTYNIAEKISISINAELKNRK